jgi:hypothetical protein
LQTLLHASDVFKLPTLIWFCMTHVVTLNVSREHMTETQHGNLTFQPYNCTLHQLIQHDEDGRIRPIFFRPVWLTHKNSGTGPTQIQDNCKNDHSTVRESRHRTWCWANWRQ